MSKKAAEDLPQLAPLCPTCNGDGEICHRCGKRAIYCECYLHMVTGWDPVKCPECGGKHAGK